MATSLAWWPTLISALIDCGHLDEAATHIGRLERAAHERGLDLTARITGVRAQLRLANGDASAAAAGLAEAVGLLGGDDPLLDRAGLHHALGRVLLAQGQRRPALDELARRPRPAGSGRRRAVPAPGRSRSGRRRYHHRSPRGPALRSTSPNGNATWWPWWPKG